MYLSIHLSIYLSVCLSVCLFTYVISLCIPSSRVKPHEIKESLISPSAFNLTFFYLSTCLPVYVSTCSVFPTCQIPMYLFGVLLPCWSIHTCLFSIYADTGRYSQKIALFVTLRWCSGEKTSPSCVPSSLQGAGRSRYSPVCRWSSFCRWQQNLIERNGTREGITGYSRWVSVAAKS